MRPLRLTPYLTALLLVAATATAHATASVTVSGTAGATALPLDGLGSSSTHIVKVATIDMDTTSAAGFSASFSSGSLTKADASTPIPFQVALVDQGAGPPAAAEFTVASGSPYPFGTSAAGLVHKDLYIKYLSASLQDPGSYSAAVNADISDK